MYDLLIIGHGQTPQSWEDLPISSTSTLSAQPGHVARQSLAAQTIGMNTWMSTVSPGSSYDKALYTDQVIGSTRGALPLSNPIMA